MKNSNLRAVTGNQHDELLAEGEGAGIVKTFDSHFDSLGDALFTWTNSTGFDQLESKGLSPRMVMAFCRANNIPAISFDTGKMTFKEHYFESDAWLFKYLEDKGYLRLGNGCFILTDEHNRPIGWVDVDTDHSTNITIEFMGAESLALELREIAKSNLKVDTTVEKKATYAEVVMGERGVMGGGGLTLRMGKIDNKRVALNEFYPYLDGGIEALLRDFIESDESVLILMGPPGTGKSSLVAAGIDALGLLPIYAKRADAILDKGFVNFVFAASDEYMAKVAGTDAKARSDMFLETLCKEREFLPKQPLLKKPDDEEEAPRIPIIVVEDADMLLAPRAAGNLIMPELLNETDGIASNHTRKIIFTTNLGSKKDIDEALMRPGRCYDVVNCRLLTPEEASAARLAHGLSDFEVAPAEDVSLATALRKPRKKISLASGKPTLGFTVK
jgi:hypothetical protein